VAASCVVSVQATCEHKLEWWHFRLNAKAKKNSLPLYVLVSLLHREAAIGNW